MIKQGNEVNCMDDIFKTDIFTSIQRNSNKKFQLVGSSLPTNQDIYFLSKWDEIFERYCSASITNIK